MSVDVLPLLSGRNLADLAFTNTEHQSEGRDVAGIPDISPPAGESGGRLEVLAYESDVLFSEDNEMHPVFPSGDSTPVDCVPPILGVGTPAKVSRVHAGRVVARMECVAPGWTRPRVPEEIKDDVRGVHLLPPVGEGTPVVLGRVRPFNAPIGVESEDRLESFQGLSAHSSLANVVWSVSGVDGAQPQLVFDDVAPVDAAGVPDVVLVASERSEFLPLVELCGMGLAEHMPLGGPAHRPPAVRELASFFGGHGLDYIVRGR